MKDSDLVYLSCYEQAELIHRRQMSPVDLVRACLARIERYDGVLHAWITVDGEQALAQARRAEAEIAAGHYRGPLHGLPYGVKDQIHAAGFPTTLGTRVLSRSEMVAPGNATVVQRLSDAGAILLGKQNLHEWGKGGTIVFPYGQPRNPWGPQYEASSSSTGSGIAVAAGQCSFAIGEDTGGSIRGPASCNGVVGLRPTFGRVSRHGGVMAGYTTDTLGPMARSVRDIALILEVISGADTEDCLSSMRPVEPYSDRLVGSVSGLRLAVVREIAYSDGISEEVATAFERALAVLRTLGATVEEVSLPWAKWAVPLQMLSTDADVASWFLAKWLRDRYDRFDQGTRTRLAAASLVPATVYNRAMRGRRLVRAQVLEALHHHDALLTPTHLMPPRKIEASQEKIENPADIMPRLMRRRIALYPFSLANVPALSVPAGFSQAGLPLALQIVGRPFGETTVLKVGHAYQQASGWADRHPDLDRTLADCPPDAANSTSGEAP